MTHLFVPKFCVKKLCSHFYDDIFFLKFPNYDCLGKKTNSENIYKIYNPYM